MSIHETTLATPRIGELLGDAFRQFASGTALESGDQLLTYGDVDRVTAARAVFLAEHCTGRRRVTLVGDRSVDAVMWALAIMRAGLTYVPLGEAMPESRRARLLDIAQPSIVVVTSDAVESTDLPSEPVIVPDGLKSAASVHRYLPGAEASSLPGDGDVAYCIFTSGSTGRPKLVQVGHEGVPGLVAEQSRLFGIQEGTRVLQFASLSFDASISEVLVTIGAGGRLVVPPRTSTTWIDAVAASIAEHGIDVITLPQSVYKALGSSARQRIRTVVFAGEALSESVFDSARTHSRVLNAYGPSETTVCVSATEMSTFTTSVGFPLKGLSVQVKDPESQVLADEGPGELVVLGAGVALGYDPRGDQPAAAPFDEKDGVRRYATGDHVVVRDGEIFYVGRADDQVKRLGHRINLGGISSRAHALLGLPADAQLIDGRLHLVVAGDVDVSALRQALRDNLPAWENPDEVTVIDSMPLTSNGKVDHKAVAAMVEQDPEDVGGGDDELESFVQGVVDRVVGTEVDPDVSIYDVGATSMSLVLIQADLGERWDDELVESVLDELGHDFSVRSFVHAYREKTTPSTDLSATDEVDSAEGAGAPLHELVSGVLADLRTLAGSMSTAPATGPVGHGPGRPLAITGASGFIGGRLVDRALTEGHDTVVISSSSPEHVLKEQHATRFSRGAEAVAAITVQDYEPAQWSAAGWDAVLHAGFHVNHALPLRRQLTTSVQSTRALVAHMARTADPRMVVLSSSSVGSKFEPLSEQALEAVSGPYSRAKFVQEEYALLLRRLGGVVHRLRLPLVYGHGASERHFLDDDVFASIVRTSRNLGLVPRFEGRIPLVDVQTVVDHSFASLDERPESEDTILVDETVRPEEIGAALGLDPSRVVDAGEWLAQSQLDPSLNPAMAKQLGPWLSAPGWDEDFATGKDVLTRLVESLRGNA